MTTASWSEIIALSLQAELGAAPVAALGVPTNSVVGAHADPLRNLTVLRHLLRERPLRAESLVRRHPVLRTEKEPALPGVSFSRVRNSCECA